MNEVITCTLLGVASTTLFDVQANPSGREVWVGVRVRTADGKTRFFPGMTVEAEASLILGTAMERGETVELWLTGKRERVYPYGIRTVGEAWYTDAISKHLRRQALSFLVIGILMLPFLGLGVYGLLASAGYLITSKTFKARYSREEFDLGYEAGVLGQRNSGNSPMRLQVA